MRQLVAELRTADGAASCFFSSFFFFSPFVFLPLLSYCMFVLLPAIYIFTSSLM